MNDDQLARQRKLLRPQYKNCAVPAPTNNARAPSTGTIKWLTWDEMQRCQALGL